MGSASAELAISAPRRRLIMWALVFGTLLASLDASFVPIAFPDMIDDLDTSTGTVVWVALGYLLAATGPMLFLARLSDRFGFSLIYRLGLVIYSLAMLGCSLAPDIRTLVAIRVVQGLGMAMFLPGTFALAGKIYPPEQRGRGLGILASANSAGFILGPIFAGWLLDSYDWRGIFWSRAPIALIAVSLAMVAFPKGLEAAARVRHAYLDVVGALLLSLGLFGVLFGMNRLPEEDNHLDPRVWLVLAAGIFFAWLFVRHERRSDSPLIDVDLYRSSPGFTKASIAFLTMFASFPVYLFILPLLLIAGLEFSAWDAGLLLAVVAVFAFVVSPLAGGLSDRFGAESLCAVGAGLVLLGYLALLTVDVEATAANLLIPMVFFGIGTGLFFSPNNRLMISSVPSSQVGMASGMIGTVRQTGYAFGFAVTASLFTIIQTRYERLWTYRSLVPLESPEADGLARIFDQGGVWSPELLVFVLHAGAILSSAALFISLLYSIPKLEFTRRRHLTVVGVAIIVAVAGLGLLFRLGGVQMKEEGVDEGLAAPSLASEAPGEEPAPFGMLSRSSVDVPSFSPPVLNSGQEVYMFYCSDCHGRDGGGVELRGVDLRASSFLANLTDGELTEYLRVGRTTEDSRNQTGRAMPGMATMSTFSPENYGQVVDFVRALTARQ